MNIRQAAFKGTQEAINEWQEVACMRPRVLHIFDSLLNESRDILVDCGGCENCLSKRSHDWYSRLYLHASSFDYCYYVTLDYAPFYHHFDEFTEADRKSYRALRGALWHYDNLNKNHSWGYHPCIVDYSHFQGFMKRLRKLLPNHKITFYVRGEYGSDFGRPHFHTILFSSLPINQEALRSAWSLYTRPIGSVDYHDLAANGTLQHCPNDPYSARNCFLYVSKYLNKTEDYCSHRLRFAYQLIKYLYVKKDSFLPIPKSMRKALRDSVLEKVKSTTFPNFDVFCKVFRPINRCSTGTAIGSVYLFDNLKRFLDGATRIDLPNGETTNLPGYFVRKVNEFRFPFRLVSRDKESPSRRKVNYQTVRADLLALHDDFVCNLGVQGIGSYVSPYLLARYAGKEFTRSFYLAPTAQPYMDKHFHTKQMPFCRFYDARTRSYLFLHKFDNEPDVYLMGVSAFGKTNYCIKFRDFIEFMDLCYEDVIKDIKKSCVTQSQNISAFKRLSPDSREIAVRHSLDRISAHRNLNKVLRARNGSNPRF